MMKKLCVFCAIFLLLTAPVFALSDAEYRQMMKDQGFAEAEKNLANVWAEAKKSLSKERFATLRKSQRAWIAKDRDESAAVWMDSGLTKVEAYAAATNERVDVIYRYMQGIDNLF